MAEQALKSLTPAQYAFIRWLNQTHPSLVAAVEERRSNLHGFMDSLSSVFKQVTEQAPDLLKQYVAGKRDLEQLKLNIARAKAGQMPIEIPAVAQVQSATAGVPMWAWAAGGAILVYLLMKR